MSDEIVIGELLKVEKLITKFLQRADKERDSIRLLLHKNEETQKGLYQALHMIQRAKIKAVNAQLNVAPSVMAKLREETGLSPAELRKALWLMKQQEGEDGSTNEKTNGGQAEANSVG
jgi:DNA-binding phage protein